MKGNKTRTIILIVAVVLMALVAAVAVGLHIATGILKSRIEQALGDNSEVGEIVVGWTAIELRRIHIRAPRGWPAWDALRAERVVVRPDLLGLLSARLHVPHIAVENAYVSAWRTRDGKFRLLPGLLEEKRGTQQESTAPAVSIGTIELSGGVLEFFDSTVRQPAHKTRLEQLHAKVDDLQIPRLTGRTRMQLEGSVKGVRRNGTLSIAGWAELANRNSEISTRLRSVDLVALQPYLIKASETGVRQGTLDLQLKSTVRNNRLHAPGTATLTGLELAPGNGAMSTFMGIPRQAVVAALKNRDGKISIDFTFEGNLNDPTFSLNDSFAKRIGAAIAEGLGISFEGLTRGVGGVAEGLGGMVKKLFGQ